MPLTLLSACSWVKTSTGLTPTASQTSVYTCTCTDSQQASILLSYYTSTCTCIYIVYTCTCVATSFLLDCLFLPSLLPSLASSHQVCFFGNPNLQSEFNGTFFLPESGRLDNESWTELPVCLTGIPGITRPQTIVGTYSGAWGRNGIGRLFEACVPVASW